MGHATSRHGEFAEVVANHLWFDVDLNKVLTVVDGNSTPNKLWDCLLYTSDAADES